MQPCIFLTQDMLMLAEVLLIKTSIKEKHEAANHKHIKKSMINRWVDKHREVLLRYTVTAGVILLTPLLLASGLCPTKFQPKGNRSLTINRSNHSRLENASNPPSGSINEILSQDTPMAIAMTKTNSNKNCEAIKVSRGSSRKLDPASTTIVTPAQIDIFLARKGSPMAGLGEKIVEAGMKNGVNPGLIVAIAGKESGFGKHAFSYNAWGWGKAQYSSWEESIECYARNLREQYLNQRSCRNINDINRRYNGHSTWAAGVVNIYKELLNTQTQNFHQISFKTK